MQLDFKSEVPIYIQIAEQIEEAVMTGVYGEESQIPSTTEISVNFKINPATVLKGMNILVDQGIIYKKRGVGMFVEQGAFTKVKEKRQQEFTSKFVGAMVAEAKRLNISKNDIMTMIERSFDE